MIELLSAYLSNVLCQGPPVLHTRMLRNLLGRNPSHSRRGRAPCGLARENQHHMQRYLPEAVGTRKTPSGSCVETVLWGFSNPWLTGGSYSHLLKWEPKLNENVCKTCTRAAGMTCCNMERVGRSLCSQSGNSSNSIGSKEAVAVQQQQQQKQQQEEQDRIKKQRL